VPSFRLLFLSQCNQPAQKESQEEYRERIRQWREKRLKNLKSPDGWLNLAGLYWVAPTRMKPLVSSDLNTTANPIPFSPPCAFTPYSTCPFKCWPGKKSPASMCRMGISGSARVDAQTIENNLYGNNPLLCRA